MYSRFIKRPMDLIFSLLAITVLSPVILIVALFVKVKLGSPVIFKQKRPGLNEKIFTIYKFRTMIDEKNQYGELLPDSVRLTNLGKLLRSTSLDELPELFNILKGDMSIVGPRPQLIRDMVFMTPEQRKRHSVLPGLTGWAQVNGRNGVTWEEKLSFDLQYVNSITFLNDWKIIFMTIAKVIKKDGISAEGMDTAEDLGDYLLRIGIIEQSEYIAYLEESNQIINCSSVRKMSELISIITPVYNSEKYVSDTINSVLWQTYKNWEMLIVDDCSNDNTAEIIKKFDDPRIKYFELDKNFGAAATRNVALENAKGKYIAFLDADDIWKPEKLEKQLEFMIKNNIGFSYTGYEILRKGKNKILKVPSKLNYSQYMKNTIIGTLTVMLNKDIVGDVRLVNVKQDHDSMTWAKLLREGNTAYGLNESLAYYRKVKGSISNDKFKAVKNHWNNCRQIEKLSIPKCIYYFIFYGINAVKKHYF